MPNRAVRHFQFGLTLHGDRFQERRFETPIPESFADGWIGPLPSEVAFLSPLAFGAGSLVRPLACHQMARDRRENVHPASGSLAELEDVEGRRLQPLQRERNRSCDRFGQQAGRSSGQSLFWGFRPVSQNEGRDRLPHEAMRIASEVERDLLHVSMDSNPNTLSQELVKGQMCERYDSTPTKKFVKKFEITKAGYMTQASSARRFRSSLVSSNPRQGSVMLWPNVRFEEISCLPGSRLLSSIIEQMAASPLRR